MSSNCEPTSALGYKVRRVIKEIYVYVIFVAVVAVLSMLKGDLFQRGNFLFPANIANLLRMSVPILMISSAFTLIFITGNMDLSVGSTLSLTTVVHAILVLNGFSFFASMAVVIVLGIVLGSINGFLVMKLRITPVIATLITMNAYQGLARYLVPPGISSITNTDVLKMPEWMGAFSKKPGDIRTFLGIYRRNRSSGCVGRPPEKNRVWQVPCRGWRQPHRGGAFGYQRGQGRLGRIYPARRHFSAGGRRKGELSAHRRAVYTGVGAETEAIIACLLGGTVFSGGERFGCEVLYRRAHHRLPDVRIKICDTRILAAARKGRRSGVRGGAESSVIQRKGNGITRK